MAKRPVGPEESSLASKLWWDADASAYLREHGEFLGDVEFKWCPEGLTEAQAGLLGPLDGKSIIEIGCGAAACARWLATQGARVVGADISGSMLQHAAATSVRTSVHVDYVQADVQRLPFAADSFDLGCSAFGALPFIPDPTAALREIHRILKPGARWVFAINHPITWIFPDDPGVGGLTAKQSYFDRTPYLEVNEEGQATYVEHHHTLGDWIRAIHLSGFTLVDLVEPEWPVGDDRTWGQWSQLRGELFPGTAIFCCEKS
jgi:SAM-dependent methyltransferase